MKDPTREHKAVTQLDWKRSRWMLGPLSSYPEVDLFDTDEDRVVAMRQVIKATGNNWRAWASLACLMAALLVADRLLDMVTLPAYQRVVLSLVVLFVFMRRYGMFFLVRPLIHAILRRQLAEKGKPICVACGYDLSGTPERCPECGRERV